MLNPISDGPRRSAEDQSVDLVLIGPDDLPTAGPSEVDEGFLEEATGDTKNKPQNRVISSPRSREHFPVHQKHAS